MRRILVGLVMLAIAAGPALAQRHQQPTPPKPEDIQKKKDREAVDRQYQDALRRTDQDAKPVKVDPWANMRGDNSKH